MSSISQLSGYFARREDPYAGGDLRNAQRLGSVFWGLLLLLTVGLLPSSPPSQPSKVAGWAITAALLLLGIWIIWLHRVERIPGWGRLLAIAYASVLSL